MAKPIAESHKTATDEFGRDCNTCETLVNECLAWLNGAETQRRQMEDDRENEEIRAIKFFEAVEALVADAREAAVTHLREETQRKREKLENAMVDVKVQMESAAEIQQDKFLDRLEFLTKIKARKEALLRFKKCVGGLPSKNIVEEVKFNPKGELDALLTKLKLLTEVSQRASTASGKGSKASTRPSTANPRQQIQAAPIRSPEATLAQPQPTSKNSKRAESKAEKPIDVLKRLPEVNIEFGAPSNMSKSKTPSRQNIHNPSIVAQPTTLAEKRNEAKLQKQGIQSNKSIVTPSQTKQPTRVDPVKDLTKASPKIAPNKDTNRQKNTDKFDPNFELKGEKLLKGNAGMVIPDKEISNMTIKELDDQKISIMSETGIENSWEGGQGYGPDITVTFMNAPFGDNILGQQGGLHAPYYKMDGNNYPRDSSNENKDQSYDIGRYLDTLKQNPDKRDFQDGTGGQYEITTGMIQAGNNYASAPINAWAKQGPLTKLNPPLQLVKPLSGADVNQTYKSVFMDIDEGEYNKQSQTIKEKLVCMGGITENKKMMVEVYDSDKQSWLTLEHLTDSRINFGIINLGKTDSLIFGGVNQDGQPMIDSQLFSTKSMTFKPHPFKLSSPKFSFGHAVKHATLFVAGGVDIHTGESLRSTEAYDLATGSSRSMAKLRAARSEFALVYCGTMNSLLAVGGKSQAGASLKSCERLNLATGLWEELPEMLIARRLLVAQAYGGFVYVAGGYDGEKPLCSVER
jgi:hypothetical protein